MPPYGFQLQKSIIENKSITTLLPTENMEIVEKIFNLYGNESLSLSQIQKELPHEKFTSSKLSKILKNPVYVKCDAGIFNYYSKKNIPISNNYEDFTGEYSCYLTGQSKKNTKNNDNENNEKLLSLAPHKGVIESNLFLICQKKLEDNKSIKNSGKGKHTWLTGLVKCGYCGYSFSVRTASTKYGTTKYFSCSGKYIHNCCTKKQTHKVEDIEKFVVDEIIKKLQEIKIPTKIQSSNKYKKEITKIENDIEHFLCQLQIDDPITTYYIKEKITQLHNKKRELEEKELKEKELKEKEGKEKLNKNRKSNSYFNYENWQQLSFDKKSLLAKKIISKIELTENNIKIFMNV